MLVGDNVVNLQKIKRSIDTIIELVNNRGSVPYSEYEYNFIQNECNEAIRQLQCVKAYTK